MKRFKNAIAIVLFSFATIAVNAQETGYNMEDYAQTLIDAYEGDYYVVVDKEIYREGESFEMMNNGNGLLIIILKKKPNGFTIKDDGPVVKIYSHYSERNDYNLQLDSKFYNYRVTGTNNSDLVYAQAYGVYANPQVEKVTVVIKNVKSNSRILAFIKN